MNRHALARNPRELDSLFAESINARDLDAVVALYEPLAVLVPEPGTVVTGTLAIREAFRTLLASGPVITDLEVKTLAQTDDIALTSARWTMKSTGPDGQPVTANGATVEVCRRQADGTWRFVIDDPWGLEWGEVAR